MGTCNVVAVWTLLQSSAARPAEPTPLVVLGADPTAARPARLDGSTFRVVACLLRAAWTLMPSAAERPA